MSSLSICVPAYNEEENLKETVLKLIKLGKELKIDYEILIVNDGSTDDTGKVAINLTFEFENVKVISYKKNLGFAGSHKICYKNAFKKWIVTFPADGQKSIENIKKLWDEREGFDIIVGYRKKLYGLSIRTIYTKTFHFLIRNYLGLKIKDVGVNKLFNKKIFEKIKIGCDDRSALMDTEILLKAKREGFRIKEVPISFNPRREKGKSKGMSPKMIYKTIIGIFKLRKQIMKEVN